ncbi:MAG: phosphatidate cytidylyltransferase [Clostridia bacterium]
MKRTLTGLSMFIVLMSFILLTKFSQYLFDVIIILFSGLTLYEMVDLGKKKGYKPMFIPLAIAFVAVYPLSIFFGIKGYLTVFGASFLLVFGFYIFDQKVEFKDFLYTLFILVYPLALISLAFLLTNNFGMIPLLIPVAAAMAADTIAYYFGSMIKGPKIFPKISPKKTYSGSIAGLFGGAFGSILVYLLFEVAKLPLNAPLMFSEYFGSHSTAIIFYIFIGIGIAVFSQIGDLGASRIKRSLEIKDFGSVLGSHGGAMDRLDSILFALVAMCIVMAYLPAAV